MDRGAHFRVGPGRLSFFKRRRGAPAGRQNAPPYRFAPGFLSPTLEHVCPSSNFDTTPVELGGREVPAEDPR